jgi:uncharacterized membrane protein
MDGHKWEYFVMSLSFIGWGLLVAFTAGIAAIWVQPYMVLSFANFYNELIEQQTAANSQQPPVTDPPSTTTPDQLSNDQTPKA